MLRKTRALAVYGALLLVVLGGVAAVHLAGRRSAPAGRAEAGASSTGKVIALSLAAEEIIIGLAGADRLGAVSGLALDPRFSNVAGEAARVPHVVSGTSIERIARLRPMLVLISPYTDSSTRDALERYGVRLFQLGEFESLGAIQGEIRRIGEVLGLAAPAGEMVREMDRRIAAARVRIPPGIPSPRVLRYDPADPWVAGSGTVIDEVIRLSGAINVAAENGVAGTRLVRDETVARWNPEVLLAEGEPGEREAIAGRIRARAVLEPVTAVRRASGPGLIVIPTRILTSVSQHAAQAVEMLVAELYPSGEPAPGGGLREARARREGEAR